MLHDSTRLSLHGIARVLSSNDAIPKIAARLEDACMEHRVQHCSHEICTKHEALEKVEELTNIRTLLENHRINLNVRQVLKDGIDQIPPNPNSLIHKENNEASF